MKTVENLLKNSIEKELCCRCGACVGVCPVDAIAINPDGLTINVEKCIDCGLCTSICPAAGYVLSDLTCEDVKAIRKYSACSNDRYVSENASSGGFVTQTLLSLLDNGDITAAAVVVTGENLEESSSKYIVTSKKEDILRARRSKYTQASIDKVLDYIKHNNGRYAVVALPCQLYAISKAMERIPSLRNRIVCKIGMVCGYTYDEECVNGLLNVLEIAREDTQSIVGWREGGLPGSFSVKMKDGGVLSMPFADEHSVDVTYFSQNRCLLCKDCLCEHGDIVCADIGGWAKRKTLVMVRTLTGKRIVDKVRAYGQMTIEPCDIPYEKTVLPFMLREKRAKVDIRIRKYEKCSRPVTDFVGGYTPRLLVAQRLECTKSIQLQELARKNRNNHSRKKMLRLGHKSYHQLSKRLTLKVLFKLQLMMNAIYAKGILLYKKVFSKLQMLLPTTALAGGKKRLKVAVVGLGRWGSQYLMFLKKSSKFDVVSAYDSDRKRAEMLGKKYGFKVADNLEDLCKNYCVDAVFILTPTPTHADVFLEVSKYHLPVYLEKPIASTPGESSKMIDAANQNSLLLYVAHSMKYEPAIQKIKQMLDMNCLGEISSVRLVRTVKSRNDNYYPNAALYQIGVHLIDVLLYLQNASACEKLYKYTQDTVENVAISQGKTSVFLRYGFCDSYNFSLYIAGEKGYILLADGFLTSIINGEKTIYHIPMINEKTIESQLNEFYCAVKNGKPYLNTKENAEKVIALCEQIAKTGEYI